MFREKEYSNTVDVFEIKSLHSILYAPSLFFISALRKDATGDADQYERNRELSTVRIRVLASQISTLSRGKSGHEAYILSPSHSVFSFSVCTINSPMGHSFRPDSILPFSILYCLHGISAF